MNRENIQEQATRDQGNFLQGQIAGEGRILLLLGFDSEERAVAALTKYRQLLLMIDRIGVNTPGGIARRAEVCRKADPDYVKEADPDGC